MINIGMQDMAGALYATNEHPKERHTRKARDCKDTTTVFQFLIDGDRFHQNHTLLMLM